MVDVMQLINIPRNFFQKLTASMYDLLKETGYFKNETQISEQDIYTALVSHPELTDDWMQYSEDKRCLGWYFKRDNKNKYLVGCLSKNGVTIETEYDDKLMACAVFIKRELDQISRKSTKSIKGTHFRGAHNA